MQTPIPTFANFFFQVGLGDKDLKSRILPDGEPEIELNLGGLFGIFLSLIILGGGDVELHPMEYHYKAETNFLYPEDTDQDKFPPFVPMFCFPNDIQLISSEDGAPPASFHSFVITEEMGARLYGVCVTFYEKIESVQLAELNQMHDEWKSMQMIDHDYEYVEHIQNNLIHCNDVLQKAKSGEFSSEELAEIIEDAEEKAKLYNSALGPLKNNVLIDTNLVYVPKCIGVLSRFPWHDLLKDWLCSLIQHQLYPNLGCNQPAPMERSIINLIMEVPLPPPGKLEVCIKTCDNTKLYFSRPPVNCIPFSLFPIFRALSISNIISLFESVLTEGKIILVSKYLAMLTITAESLLLLIWPMSWHHILIPVLPSNLLGYLQAPVPYIIGVQSNYFDVNSLDEIPTDAIIVDIDNDLILNNEITPRIPTKERKRLVSRLQKYSALCPHAETERIPITIREAFPLGLAVTRTSESTIVQTSSCESLNTYRKSRSLSRSEDTRRRTSLIGRRSTGRKSTAESPLAIQADIYSPLGSTDLGSEVVGSATTEGTGSTPNTPTSPNRKGFFSRRISIVRSEHIRSSTDQSRASVGSRRSNIGMDSSDESEYSSHSKRISSSQSLNDPFHIVIQVNGHIFHDAMDDQELLNTSENKAQCQYCKEFSDDQYQFYDFLKCSVHASCIEIVQGHPCKSIFNENKIQRSFLKVFTSILKNYRTFLISDSVDECFKKAEFLTQLDKESRPFFKLFMETHAFTQFIVERIEREESDFELLFFDESIKAKTNRSKMKFSKETTPFLEDQTYSVSQTIEAIDPNLEGLLPSENSEPRSTFPTQLNPKLFVAPRKIKQLATPADQRIMQSRTAEMVRRMTKETSMKDKMDKGRKWFRKMFRKKADGDLGTLGILSEDHRLNLFEDRINEVADVVDHYEALHLSSQSRLQIRTAIKTLLAQHLILMRATDDEQLVEIREQQELQRVFTRLFTVITIYEDFVASLPDSQSAHSLLATHDDEVAISEDEILENLNDIALDDHTERIVEPEFEEQSKELPELPVKIIEREDIFRLINK